MNKRRMSVNFGITATLAILFGTAMTTANSAWADTIICPNVPPNKCNGTSSADKMIGASDQDDMRGLAGDDEMTGGSARDTMSGGAGADEMAGNSKSDAMLGNAGDDVMSGDTGNDQLGGGTGSDVLNGNNGNDRIYHGDVLTNDNLAKRPDGSADEIHCGNGDDVAIINSSVDGDTADDNCETVIAG